MPRLFFSFFLFLYVTQICRAEVIVYPAPKCNLISKAYILKVKDQSSGWKKVDIYKANVAGQAGYKISTKKTSFAYFDCSGRVDVSVTVMSGTVKQVKIRPLAYGVVPKINGNTITFSLNVSQNISVEVNGDIFENLQIFANPIETSHPLLTDTNVIYFGPGIHKIGKKKLVSDKTVYIAGGAIVQGSFVAEHVKNIIISGRGILTQAYEPDNAITTKKPESLVYRNVNDQINIQFSQNISISGIVVIPRKYSVLIGQSKNVKISDIKSFSCEGNADGIDIFCSSGVLIDHVFMRNSDDCIAIYGHRWSFYGNVDDVTVRNSVLWADVAHPILVGTHGDTAHPDTLQNIKFENIDILDQHENQIDYQGCLALNAGDDNLIRNVRFDGINIEHIRKGQLVNLRVMFNHKYNTSPGRGIEDVYFKNIAYTGQFANTSIISGYDDNRKINNITFENLKVNGKIITDNMKDKPVFYKTGDMINFFIGEHVDGLRFIGSATAAQKPVPPLTATQ